MKRINENLIIGIDFDNTIITYDKLLHKLAIKKQLIEPVTSQIKKKIRDKIRLLPDGENKWQKLQIDAYGIHIKEAELSNGIDEFFNICKEREIKTYMVSHKTQYPNLNYLKVDLRKAALDWMSKHAFFDKNGFYFKESDVFFESTRKDKIARIKQLKCTHFIDDLEETFFEETFPKDIKRILYSPHEQNFNSEKDFDFTAKNWNEITEYLFAK